MYPPITPPWFIHTKTLKRGWCWSGWLGWQIAQDALRQRAMSGSEWRAFGGKCQCGCRPGWCWLGSQCKRCKCTRIEWADGVVWVTFSARVLLLHQATDRPVAISYTTSGGGQLAHSMSADQYKQTIVSDSRNSAIAPGYLRTPGEGKDMLFCCLLIHALVQCMLRGSSGTTHLQMEAKRHNLHAIRTIPSTTSGVTGSVCDP